MMSDRILIKKCEKELVSAGGIHLINAMAEKSVEGEIVAVGPGRIKDDGTVIPMTLKVGDKVLLAHWNGTETKIDGKDHLIAKESEVLAILE